MLWLGTTSKDEEEFLQYFNQGGYINVLSKFENGESKKRPSPDLRCQFCKDLNIKFYYPQYLTAFYCHKEIEVKELIERHTKDPQHFDRSLSLTTPDIPYRDTSGYYSKTSCYYIQSCR
jgi:hypothetical protein